MTRPLSSPCFPNLATLPCWLASAVASLGLLAANIVWGNCAYAAGPTSLGASTDTVNSNISSLPPPPVLPGVPALPGKPLPSDPKSALPSPTGADANAPKLLLNPIATPPGLTPLPPASADGLQSLVLEDFEKPTAWEGGNKRNDVRDYNVVNDEDVKTNHLLRSKFLPGTDGKAYYRQFTWNTKRFPFITWRWRVKAMPTGAKIEVSGKSDAPGQVYVAWKAGGRVHSLKYVWAESDPVGTQFRTGKWNPFGTLFVQVIRTGGELNKWQVEKRNLIQDYVAAFGKEPPDEAAGISVLTDGDGTKTEPSADFDDFVAWTR